MRVSTNVSFRGMILVAIPLVLQVIFVVWLTMVLSNAQSKLQAQWASEEFIRLACLLSRDTTDVIVYMQMPHDVQELVGKDVSDMGMEKPRKDFELIKTLSGQEPRRKGPLEEIERVGRTLFSLQQRELEKAEQLRRRYSKSEEVQRRLANKEARKARRRAQLLAEGKPVPERLLPSDVAPHQTQALSVTRKMPRAKIVGGVGAGDDYKATLSRFGPRFYDAIDQLVRSEEAAMKDVNAFGAKSISEINNMLLVVALSGIGVTVLLGYLYSVSIRKPLRHLGENGKRLSARQLLLPELKGEDEFAQLDRLLHLNSSEVELALARERAVIANAADLICVLDENGDFQSINPFVERLLGYLPEELLGSPMNTVAAPEQSLLADEYIRNAKAGGEQLFELSLRKRDGETVETRWSCIWSQEDQKLFCVVHDISEEKAIEQLKQDFADMISHDLRSPLMAMSNSLSLIEAGVKGEIPEEARAGVQTSARNVEKLIALVNDLLDFQKLKAGKMQLNQQRHSLHSIVKEAAGLLAESAEAKSVKLSLPEGNQEIDCDSSKLTQTVVNLLSNAIKFSEKGSEVAVQIGQSDGVVRLSVRDTGPGVPDHYRTKIFEPFEQAPSARAAEGTGLGLAICKLVVEEHGGRIYVEPSQSKDSGDPAEKGSVFVIELPVR